MAAPQATFALLGPFELRLDGQPIEIRAARVRALVTMPARLSPAIG
jgi:hypothetical protein